MSVARLVMTQETGIYYRGRRTAVIRTPVNKAGPDQHDVIRLAPSREASKTPAIEAFPPHEQPLEFFNGLGGFAQDGREYVIRIRNAMKPPAPWINVIANEKFGFIISETGAGYTWAGNSRENKLTSWSNDPVLDPVSEAVFIRDETSGAVTSPCMLGGGFGGHYQIRHGFGYSIFEHDEISLRQQLAVFTAAQDLVKLWLLTITNSEQTARKLTVTFFVEWLLGVQRDQTAPFVVTGFDRVNECLTARNTYNELYREHRAFIFSSEKIASFTGSRREFLGTTGFSRYPQGLSSASFSGSVGAGLDPCGVLQVCITLEPGESRSLVFGLGQAESENLVADLVQRLRSHRSATA